MTKGEVFVSTPLKCSLFDSQSGYTEAFHLAAGLSSWK